MASDQEISQINAAGLIVATIIHEIGNPLSIALSAFNVMQLHRGNADIFNEAIDDAGQALQMMQNVLNATRGLVRGDVDVEDVSMAQLSLEMSRYKGY
jgi:signal transduction histidine kinase